jgi:hypothetical protein
VSHRPIKMRCATKNLFFIDCKYYTLILLIKPTKQGPLADNLGEAEVAG